MATEEEANRARELHADALVKHGAHAVGVASGRPYGKRGFVVVAYVSPGHPHDLPETVTSKIGKSEVDVAVVKKIAERFAPE